MVGRRHKPVPSRPLAQQFHALYSRFKAVEQLVHFVLSHPAYQVKPLSRVDDHIP